MTTHDPVWGIIAGGGTAGHVLPAIAVADALVANGHPRASLHFVGSARGIERRLVPDAGYSLTVLPGRGIQRRVTVDNIRAVAGLSLAVAQMVARFARRRPAVVLSVGGYASLPCAIAATLWRVPLVLAEANSRAGAANRVVARYARACAVAFPDTGLPRAEVTGNPVRPDVAALADPTTWARVRRDTRRDLAISETGRMVVVFGGSLGARRINDAAIQAAGHWAGREDFVLYLVTGERDALLGADALAAWLTSHPNGSLDWRVVAYENDMPRILAAADVVVSRAGATSVADAAVAGLPCVLVPLPIAAEDHQTANARAVVHDGAGVLVPDSELDGLRLVVEVDAILGDPVRAHSMRIAARRRGRPDASASIAALVEKHARRKDPTATDQHTLG